MKIGSCLIGPGRPVYTIAEAGVNHDGVVEKALRLCAAAAEAGADAVKFQAFCADELAGPEAKQAAYQSLNTGRVESQRDMLKRLELSSDDFAKIMKHCREIGIEFLASPFDVTSLSMLVALGVRAIKIASQELVDLPLLVEVGRTGLPVIASTGAATEDLIDQAVRFLRDAGTRWIVLLHCFASYPTPRGLQNLRAIGGLVETFDCVAGYSDHSQDVESGRLAAWCGACVLEKHFALSREDDGPDHAMSLEPGELAEYIRRARDIPVDYESLVRGTAWMSDALGDGLKTPHELELESRDVSRKSLAAAADIPSGTCVASAADVTRFLTTQPRGTGDPKTNACHLRGRTFTTDVPRGEIIYKDMLSEDAS